MSNLRRYGQRFEDHSEWPQATVSGQPLEGRPMITQGIGGGFFVAPDNPRVANHDELIEAIKIECGLNKPRRAKKLEEAPKAEPQDTPESEDE